MSNGDTSVTTSEPQREAILDALRTVVDPDLGRDIVSLGFVKDIAIDGGRVRSEIELTTPACPLRDQFRAMAEQAIRDVPGVTEAEVVITARVRSGPRPHNLAPGIKHVIAVASGKGGVGKSTVACNVAVALAQSGAKVGILDSDVYGPTIPLMMGVDSEPESDGERIVPIIRHGVSLMSMGFFLDDDKAVVWRGPMIGKALQQFFEDVAWGELDYLIVDLPPGTGDAPLSLAQMMPLTGVIIVMTPQDVAQRIANKAIAMFRTMEESLGRPLPILGIVENMSGFVCPHCRKETPLFGSGGGRQAAERLGVPFLGAVPIDPVVTESGDQGQPSILRCPDSPQAQAFRAIAGEVAARVSRLYASQAGDQ
jgi:ATP-binding protein involved in chromosome partitioning